MQGEGYLDPDRGVERRVHSNGVLHRLRDSEHSCNTSSVGGRAPENAFVAPVVESSSRSHTPDRSTFREVLKFLRSLPSSPSTLFLGCSVKVDDGEAVAGTLTATAAVPSSRPTSPAALDATGGGSGSKSLVVVGMQHDRHTWR